MNDLVLDDGIQDTGGIILPVLQQEEPRASQSKMTKDASSGTTVFRSGQERDAKGGVEEEKVDSPKGHRRLPFRKIPVEETVFDEDEDEVAIYQPTLWWFTSTAFPLFAGTFGPIATLFSVCALIETWKIRISDGSGVPDPPWLIAMNACSLLLALGANLILLFNFARRIRYSLAQPLTISLWYLSSLLLVIPIGLTHDPELYAEPKSTMAYSQSYYYALISSVIYAVISTFLLCNVLGAYVFHAYRPSFNVLTVPQRTLMLQTMSFSLYLALGAVVIGLGTDFPLTKTSGRLILIPYAAFGITLLGLVVGSVRGLVLERAKEKVVRRHLGKERDRWMKTIERRRKHLAEQNAAEGREKVMEQPSRVQSWFQKRKEKKVMHLPKDLASHVPIPSGPGATVGSWHRIEFELMRHIEEKTFHTQQYTALSASFVGILIVWIGGSLIFWSCEHKSQSWTYPESLYFTYTTLLTIGYGDFYPNSNAGKPFFVVWSLISVPAMTILISNMGDTVVHWVKDATAWASRYTILPERSVDKGRRFKHRMRRRRHRKARRAEAAIKEKEKREAGNMGRPIDDTGTTSEQEPPSALTREKEDPNLGGLPEDVERLGSAIESAEENRGRGKSLSARLAREISLLAKDIGKKPQRKYDWSDWSDWLEMLGADAEDEPSKSQESESNPRSSPDDKPAHASHHATLATINKGQASAHADHQPAKDWSWTWLADKGPLLSQQTETEWILEKLCMRLEEVLENEAYDKT